MPSSVYKSLRLGALELTSIVIQLVNRSIAHPLGILEDVLVQVSNMIFPANFYVLDMKDELSSKGPTLILSRPFLKTSRTKIDVHAGTLSMEFGDNRVEHTIFEVMKHLIENHSIFYLDVIDLLGDDYMNLHFEFPNFGYFKDCDCTCTKLTERHEMLQQPILFGEVFDVWCIDFMGPFPVSNGYSYILLAVDYVSRWVDVIATKTNDAKVVVDFLMSNIFCQFGVPKTLISDQGNHLCNRAMSYLLNKYGVVHRIAIAYQPQTTAKLKFSTGK
ncbi:pol, partial [Mucuna pruriens]